MGTASVSGPTAKRRFEPKTLKRFLESNFLTADYEAASDIASGTAYFDGVRFGAIDVFRHEANGLHRGYRRLHHYRADHVDDFMISLPLRGRTTLIQTGRSVEAEAGSFIISSTAKPFVVTSESDADYSSFLTYHVRVSGPMLRARIPHIDMCCPNPIAIKSGAGEIMASMLTLALQQGQALTERQTRLFGIMLIDAITNALRDAPELIGQLPQSSPPAHTRIRESATDFISWNLSNHALNPELIAQYCGVSVRRLHAAFSEAAQTVGSLIREMRLDRCREALRSPDLRDRSVFEIAMRWGFNDPAHFSRAYKSRFGKSPKDDR